MKRLHPLSAVFLALNRGVSAMFILFFLVSFAESVFELPGVALPIVAGALGFAVGSAYGVAYYYRFGYSLEPDTFDIASGVVARRSREIPYRRIQNVDITQGILLKLLGLAVVAIETAGGGSTEGTLNFVSRREADRLQREIRARTASSDRGRRRRSAERDAASRTADDRGSVADETLESGTGFPASQRSDVPGSEDAERREEGQRDEPAGDGSDESGAGAERTLDGADSTYRPRTLFELDAKELLLYSFASFRPAAVAAAGFLFFFASEFALEYLVRAAQPVGGPSEIGAGTTGNYLVLSLVSMVHAVVVTYVISVVYSFVSYYGFRLGKAGEDLVYERGLLQRYSGSIPLEKVQSVTITDNPLQRAIGYAGLWVETAGYGPESNGGSQSAVPLARVPRVHQFTERLSGIEPPTFDRPTRIARRRYLVRFSLVATALVALAYGLDRVWTFPIWWLSLAAYVVVPPAAHLRWKHLGYYVGEDHLVIRQGFWRRRTTVVPYYRVQTVSTRRSVFQRRLGLGSLVVDTASSRSFFWSSPTIPDVKLPVARRIQRATRDRLQEAVAERASDAASDVDL
ncbi:PH domain-containing protein [Halovivax limisalsi]|uniref:PH domain-containing protein n=1 Tax=Halovivax limisalsi TaxID=1453760 RepID=UPI001FFCD2CD|nr:PH domain-containing protein [Halovivax limisalsi]